MLCSTLKHMAQSFLILWRLPAVLSPSLSTIRTLSGDTISFWRYDLFLAIRTR
ncbi:uncharacterized protein BYT42DRAFT_567403 [Radiomyces spectabilis]|uniref:uncharacterized protein n=1 Tax=Radiomyces spectabilis TaxID=64574 RepID=UPI00221FA923|nr:uncharacterized protein BYT42DRAFT_567403 [Radiomyces spectabilis]KAI8379087.1 hypothetical protein BYT42DRAFT_567403 [Radiomyces spectabilis]